HTRFDCDWSSDVCSSDLGERMLGASENIDEAPEQKLEAPRGIGRRQVGSRSLLADDELQFRDQIDDKAAMGLDRLEQGLPPSAEIEERRVGKERRWRRCT